MDVDQFMISRCMINFRIFGFAGRAYDSEGEIGSEGRILVVESQGYVDSVLLSSYLCTAFSLIDTLNCCIE